MPFIDPKNPGNSYILYKMILGTLHCPAGPTDDAVDPLELQPGTRAATDFRPSTCIDYYEYDAGGCNGTVVHQKGDLVPYPSWVPDAEWKSPAANEYQRLAFRIRGTSMPPNQGVAPQDLHRISAWIAAGAPCRVPAR